MKKLSIVIILAAFAWSISACTNRNKEDMNRDQEDSIYRDTSTSPVDTTNVDTTVIQSDTLGMENQ